MASEKVKVKETFIERSFRFVKSIRGSSRVINSLQALPFGFDSVPYEGVQAVRNETMSDTIVTGYIQVAFQDLKEGESVVFSKTKDGYKSKIILRNDESIEFLGTGDFLVRFNGLENWVKDLATKINSHTHTYAPGPLPPVQTGIPSAIISDDISESKAENLKTK